MNAEQLIEHYGGSIEETAKAHKVTIDAVYKWRHAGINHARQCQIEVETGYALLSDYTVTRNKLSAGGNNE